MKKIRLSHSKKYHTLSILFHFWRKKAKTTMKWHKMTRLATRASCAQATSPSLSVIPGFRELYIPYYCIIT